MARFATDKEQAHELIDRLAPSQVSAVVSVLQAMLDPVAKAIVSAPIDNEPETADEQDGVTRSKESFQRQSGHSSEQLMAELGIDPKDLTPKA